MKKVLIIALFATVVTAMAHVPDSTMQVIQNRLFNHGYIKLNINNGDQAPYIYSTTAGMEQTDTVFYTKNPGNYKVFLKSTNNPTTQYQINVVVKPRPAIVKDINGNTYIFDGKVLKYRGLKANIKDCE